MISMKRKFQEAQVEISAEDFRKRFKSLFDLDPRLSDDDIYLTLASQNFDVQKTEGIIRRGWNLPLPVKDFVIPSFVMSDGPKRSTTTSSCKAANSSAIRAGDSDEILERPRRSHKQVSRSSRGPRGYSGSSVSDDDSSKSDSEEGNSGMVDSDEEATDDIKNWENKLYTKGQKVLHSQSIRSRLHGNPNNAVLKHRETTKLTPWLYKLAKPFYNEKIEEIKCKGLITARNSPLMNDKDILSRILSTAKYPEVMVDSRKPPKLSQPMWDYKSRKRVYSSAKMNGIRYSAGDFVLFPQTIIQSNSNTLSKNPKSAPAGQISTAERETSIARIEYFSEDQNSHYKIFVHVRWFEFGQRTILGEFARHGEIFSLTDCQDVPMNHVYGKIHVALLSDRECKEVGLGEVPQPDDQLFYRFHYNPDTNQFTDASHYEIIDSDSHWCYCCKVEDDTKCQDQVRMSDKVPHQGPAQYIRGVRYKNITYKKIEYRLHDFVYIVEPSGGPYVIAQIIGLETKDPERTIDLNSNIKPRDLKITVDLYERYDTFHPPWIQEISNKNQHAVRDERRLYRKGQVTKIDVHELDGKCSVKLRNDIPELNSFKDKMDTFWVEEEVKSGINPYRIKTSDLSPIKPNTIPYSLDTEVENRQKEEKLKEFLECGLKLRGLDLFCGAGALSVGLMEGLQGALEFKNAVEFSEAACRTYAENHHGCTIHNGDASLLLQRAIYREQGQILHPLHDCHGHIIPDLPQPGDIDFICGGPPCPGFSGLNRSKTPDDIKNSLVILFLAYLDFYKPKYFLMENVAQILTAPLESVQGSDTTTIERGTLKFILRFATSFGYQIQFTLLQAGEYGTPQSRTRAFVWGSQSGCLLPPYPQPENVLKGKTKISGRKANGWHLERRGAPHHVVTVGDAISDLSAFEWKNPCGYTLAERKERENRSHRIDQYEVDRISQYTGQNSQPYASRPLSEFQRKSRVRVTSNQVTSHVTGWVNEKQVWKVCKVPLKPGADHRDIKGEYAPEHSHTKKNIPTKDLQPGRFGRLDMENVFKACHTSLDPGLVPGTLLHPTQYRIISIRENARAMGFSDNFVFDLDDCKTSTIKDIIRQIGNAVPPTFVKPIGNALLWVLVDVHHRENQSKSGARAKAKPANREPKTKAGSRHDPIVV